MILHRQDSTWEVQAPAKLNLCLDVLGRLADGYHEVETLMVPLRVHDSIQLVSEPPSDGRMGSIHFQVDLPLADSVTWNSIPLGHDNLVYRAIETLRRIAGIPFGARIRLIKRIPSQAGLGGGSSDAAAALVAANAAWNLNWNRGRLAEVASFVGSDVPFFLDGGAAVCRGRGEQVTHVPHATALHVVVVWPPIGLSTRDVFGLLDTMANGSGYAPPASGDQGKLSRRMADAVAALVAGRVADLGRLLFNHLERPARRLTDWMDRLSFAFENYVDVAGHIMTGSGTAYFGLCRNAFHAHRVAATLRSHRLGWICASQAVSWTT